MNRVWLAVAGAALLLIGGAVLTWGAVSPGGDRSARVDGVEQVRFTGRSADVRIRYEPGGSGEVRENVRRWAVFGGEGPSHRVDGGTLVLNGDCGWWCSVDYDVVLPAAVPVEGEVGSGDVQVVGMRSAGVEVGSGGIEVTGVERSVRARSGSGSVAVRDVGGAVEVNSGSGTVELDSIRGDLRAQTGSGRIEGEDIASADVYARTSSGGLDLALTRPREAELSTGSGRIDLTVPQGRYDVRARTGSGQVSVGVAEDPAAERELVLSTGSGDVEVTS